MTGPGLQDRAAGALWGLAIGDALGMPTQLLSREAVWTSYGEITGFEAPAAGHPVAAGLAPGTVTDDTEQALLLAGLLGVGGALDQQAWADALLAWEDAAIARGSPDLLGPSTKAAMDALRAGGSVDSVGGQGTTNGAAMRVCPVGIAVPSADATRLVAAVVAASRLTHHTSVALSAAGAVAGAVSAGLDGADFDEAVRFAVRIAGIAGQQGRWVAAASVARRIEWAVAEVRRLSSATVGDFVVDLVGTSLASQESVPAAFAVAAAAGEDPWRAVCLAAGLGGDSDTIAAIAGALLGAVHGKGCWPAHAVRVVGQVNRLDLDGVAARLLAIRRS